MARVSPAPGEVAGSAVTAEGLALVGAAAAAHNAATTEEPPPPRRRNGWCRRQYRRFLQQDEAKVRVHLWCYRRRPQAVTALLCAVVLGVFACVLLGAASAGVEITVTYTAGDKWRQFVVENDLEGPLQFSYEIPDFFANQRRYIEGKDSTVVGGLMTSYNCDDAETVDEVRWRRPGDDYFLGLMANVSFSPCGLVALAMFTDDFLLYDKVSGSEIRLDQSDIALPGDDLVFDKLKPGKTPNSNLELEGSPTWVRNGNFFEHFKVWYHSPASPRVRNLWAVIPGGLKAGTYELRLVENSPTWTTYWKVPEKRIIISQLHTLGNPGACTFLGVVCLVFSCAELVTALVFFLVPAHPPA